MRVKTTCSLPLHKKGDRERWEKGDNRKAGSFVVRLRDRVRCGRSDQILEYIARSIEEETSAAEGRTDERKEFAGWGD